MSTTVWFNKGFSHLYHAVESIKTCDEARAFRVLCSDARRNVPIAAICDVFEQEPRGLTESAYIDFCLDVVERHRVKLIVPNKHTRALVRARPRFEQAGAQVLAAGDADTLQLLESKADQFKALGADLVTLPDYEVVHDLAGFDAAFARLSARHDHICFKPAVALFGLGFRIIRKDSNPLDRLLQGDNVHVSLEEARAVLGERLRLPALMVMQYLKGPERSVDCLARHGQLLRWVIRRKHDGCQFLEDHPVIEEQVRSLTSRLRLDGIFNVQFRDEGELPYLLEINPRMSGGIHYANLSGLSLPYWAVRLKLGMAEADDLPVPQTGIWVSQINRAIRIPAGNN